MVVFFCVQLFKFIMIDINQCMSWVSCYICWVVFMMVVQVVFIGFGFVSLYIQICVVVVDYWMYYYFYCIIWVSYNVGFVINVMFLYYMNKFFIMVDSIIWVDVSVWCIFILMVNCCCGNVYIFNDMDMW